MYSHVNNHRQVFYRSVPYICPGVPPQNYGSHDVQNKSGHNLPNYCKDMQQKNNNILLLYLILTRPPSFDL